MKWIQMMETSRRQHLSVGVWIIALSFCALNCLAQVRAKSNDGKLRPKMRDSITVTATSTPEEAEEGKLNDAYQSVFIVEQRADCETAIRRYESEVMPLAQQSK